MRNRYKVAKHFVCDIEDDRFEYRRDRARIATEAALDGVYIIRTSLAAADLSAADCVRSYKARSTRVRALKIKPMPYGLPPKGIH